LIENGRIVGPANNFRFNESPAAVLANVLALGPSERTRGGNSKTRSPPRRPCW
jgi:predicted Zn-dependent protease